MIELVFPEKDSEINWGPNNTSTETKEIILYDYHPVDGVFLGQFKYLIPDGTGLPAHSTLKRCGQLREGYVQVYDPKSGEWAELVDLRGQTAYDVLKHAEVLITSPGEVSFPLTMDRPKTPFDEWVNGTWVTNKKKQKAAKRKETSNEIKKRLAQSNQLIQPIFMAMQNHNATPAQEKCWDAWYLYQMSLMKVDPLDPVWPEEPSLFLGDYEDDEEEEEEEE